MTTDEDLDRMWRSGLTTAADGIGVTTGVRGRVAARVRHRRRTRRAASAGAVAALAATTAVGVRELHSGRTPVQVTTPNTTATTAPVGRTVVNVNEAPGGTLRIEFPGHDLGNPASITLPSGVVRFVIHGGGAGHVLRIEDVPGFEADFTVEGQTITKDVSLAAGRVYVMYCAIPGHREAGESVIIVVR